MRVYVPSLSGHVQLFEKLWAVTCQSPLPCDSPGMNTGVGCHVLLQGSSSPRDRTHVSCSYPHCKQIFFFFFFFFTTEPPGKPIVVRLLSHVWRFATPWTAAHQTPHPSQSPGVCSNSCSLSWWCHPNVSSSVLPSSPSSFPASESFLVSRPFTSGGQSIGASA